MKLTKPRYEFPPVQLPPPATGVGHFGQQIQLWRKRSHGNLGVGCRDRSHRFADLRLLFAISLFTLHHGFRVDVTTGRSNSSSGSVGMVTQ
jgi:hypothetical protein